MAIIDQTVSQERGFDFETGAAEARWQFRLTACLLAVMGAVLAVLLATGASAPAARSEQAAAAPFIAVDGRALIVAPAPLARVGDPAPRGNSGV